jgi:hypothetical protein
MKRSREGKRRPIADRFALLTRAPGFSAATTAARYPPLVSDQPYRAPVPVEPDPYAPAKAAPGADLAKKKASEFRGAGV